VEFQDKVIMEGQVTIHIQKVQEVVEVQVKQEMQEEVKEMQMVEMDYKIQ